jgi:uncharacterized protein with PIN domain
MSGRTRFLADRMLGTLTRYLRLMGYDTLSANNLAAGNRSEDTLLLSIAKREGRIILTRDRELARRGGDRGLLVTGVDVLDQVAQLLRAGYISPDMSLKMERCSLCNTPLRPATAAETASADYAPEDKSGLSFYWCPACRRLYWMGSHGRNLQERLESVRKKAAPDIGGA